MGIENDSSVNENSTADIVNKYRNDVSMLTPYLPWLLEHADTSVSESYSSDELSHSISFPVYDSTLLSFVKKAQETKLLDRNYVYVYSRNHLSSAADELSFIKNAQIQDMGDLAGIISGYILRGMTKGSVWSEGVHNKVLYSVIAKMQELITFWGNGEGV